MTDAVATARVIEKKELNLEEDLKPDISDLKPDNLEMIEQPSLEEVLNVDTSEEDLDMAIKEELPDEDLDIAIKDELPDEENEN